jgi:7-cyano-7-deazaguanine reductase
VNTAITSTPLPSLATFQNPKSDRDYLIRIRIPEFTCLCPKTGQPDFATLRLAYVPDHQCLELKALKLYIWSYRETGAYHEDITNRILDDVVAAIRPRFARIEARFNVRGGLYTTVIAHYQAPEWAAPAGLDLG